MKYYIAGPMTGYNNFNRDAFYQAGVELMGKGHTVLTPAMLPDGLSQAEYMDICFAMVRAADCMLMLKGWEGSSGATAELYYALKLDLTICYQ